MTKIVNHVREMADIGGLSDTSCVVPILNLVRRACQVPAEDLERALRAVNLDFLIASAAGSSPPSCLRIRVYAFVSTHSCLLVRVYSFDSNHPKMR